MIISLMIAVHPFVKHLTMVYTTWSSVRYLQACIGLRFSLPTRIDSDLTCALTMTIEPRLLSSIDKNYCVLKHIHLELQLLPLLSVLIPFQKGVAFLDDVEISSWGELAY